MGHIHKDAYPTPPRLASAGVHLALELYPRFLGETIKFLEPGAGITAPFCKAIEDQLGHRVVTAGVEVRDIKEHIPELSKHCDLYDYNQDFLEYEPAPEFTPDLIVTNPPYSLAEQFVRHSMKILSDTGLCIMLIQCGFSGSNKRIPFWSEYPPIFQVMPRPRPGFVKIGKNSSDSREYYFYVWAGKRLARFLRQIGRDWTAAGYTDNGEAWKSKEKVK